jgi:hypothetical protein
VIKKQGKSKQTNEGFFRLKKEIYELFYIKSGLDFLLLEIHRKQRLVEREGIINKARLWKITEKGLEILRDEKALEKLRKVN